MQWMSGSSAESTEDGAAPRDELESLRNELARHRDDLRVILEAMPALVFYKDTNNRIVRVNRAVAESLGVSPEDMADTPTERWYPVDAASYYEDDLLVMRSKQPRLGIVERLDVAGDRRWIQTDKLPRFDESGNVVGILVIALDITDRKRLEQELLQAQKLDSIGRLAGGVAHDFNNLLTTILGNIEVARKRMPVESDATEHLNAVRLAAERGADLTRQLLAFARRQVIKPKATDLNALLEDSDRLLRRVLDENIELRTNRSEVPLPVMVDSGQISQVIMNMALNARDAMPNGGVLTLSASSIRIDEAAAASRLELLPGSYVVLSIADTGHGLTEEVRQHLFEPFFTTKPLGAGTGLGLATCYGMIKQNRGHIEVSSTLERGTTFTIYLPRASDEAFDAEPDSRTSRETLSLAEQVQPGTTVLLVEDDDALRKLATQILSDAGYTVLSASNGEHAQSLAEAHPKPINLLLTDVIMPRMGGPMLAARLRVKQPDLKVLYISGYSENTIAREGVLPRGIRLLQKPFNAEQLLEMVRCVLAHPSHPV
jgi:PAS domain S-box-containing protein